MKRMLSIGILLGMWLAFPGHAKAHCDTLDGPVVEDAYLALKSKDVTPVLKWIQPEYESGVRAAFQKALIVRSKGREAKELADTYFFETLVRLHRTGEGEPFTGLKPAGNLEPAFFEADRALETGSIDPLVDHIKTMVETGIRQRYQAALEKRALKDQSIEAGREYVEAYVTFLHTIERLMGGLSAEPHHWGGEP